MKSFLARFERQVDPLRMLPVEVPRRMTLHARRADKMQLAEWSAQARQGQK